VPAKPVELFVALAANPHVKLTELMSDSVSLEDEYNPMKHVEVKAWLIVAVEPL
jgi:hypothetical protein